MIKFFVPGIPKPRQSTRFRAVLPKGGKKPIAVAYQKKDDKVSKWLDMVYLTAMEHRPDVPLTGPIGIDITFYRKKPKSWPKKRNFPTTRPDWDNLSKGVCDILEGVYYNNDSQIVDAYIKKRLSKNPGVFIKVWELDEVGYVED